MHENRNLLKVFENLSDYCQEYKVISEGELALKIRECLESLSDAEREELERKLGGKLKDLIFKSITSEEKISVFSPDMRTRINYQGEIFYCLPTHRYMVEELEGAFLRWTKIRSPLGAVKKVVWDFVERCGYRIQIRAQSSDIKVEEKGHEFIEMMAEKEDKRLHIFIFSSIKFVPPFIGENQALLKASEAKTEEKEVIVIAVPTEKTPAPFISFCREQDIGDVMIWVADVEKNTIDPFIGIHEDEAIENNFAHPEQARRAVSIWMKKMHFIDL
ncbi:hypothetical protein CW714_08685 [Methanophagales archaeon]|nr:MAG: hypothetical protein CW714_08685 [Methanophagales archaeon]